LLVGHSVKHAHLVKVRRTTAQTAERRQVVGESLSHSFGPHG
jgi:hypothetical protein